MDKDVELLKDCIENRAPILLLGAGFSLDAKGKCGKPLMLGGELTQRLFDHSRVEWIDEELPLYE